MRLELSELCTASASLVVEHVRPVGQARGTAQRLLVKSQSMSCQPLQAEERQAVGSIQPAQDGHR